MASPNNNKKPFYGGKSDQPQGFELNARNVTDKDDAHAKELAEWADLRRKLDILKRQVDSLGYGGGSAEQFKQKWDEILSGSELLKRAKQSNRQSAEEPTQSEPNGNQGDHCTYDPTNNDNSEITIAETSFTI